MANAFYKGTKMEKLDRECRRNAALYNVSRKYTRCSRSCRTCTKKGKKIRVVGSGHSFTPLVQTEEILVSLDELKGITNIDTEKMTVEVWAGTKLHDLGSYLRKKVMHKKI